MDLSSRPPHKVTTAHLQAAYPFQAEAGLGNRGLYIGQGSYGAAFVFDPWELYEAELLTDPNMFIAGHVGSAKSSLAKTMIWRASIFNDRRAFVVDPKGEYDRLAAAMGCKPIRLRPGGEVRLNPLHRAPGPEGEKAQLGLLLAIVSASLGRDLEPGEASACTEALREVAKGSREPIIPDVVEKLLRPTPAMAKALATTTKALAEEARYAALALKQLCEGTLAGMFDGPSSDSAVDFDAPLIVLDLSAMMDEGGIGILMACATAWLHAEIMRQRQSGRAVKNLWIIDEGWKILSHPGVGEWLQNAYKQSRAFGVANVMVVHRVADLTAAGDRGSRVSQIAEGLISDTSTHIIYRQPAAQMDLLDETYGLSETEQKIIRTASKGEALWMVGNRRFVVAHMISPIERELVDTDQQMGIHREFASDSESFEAAA